MKKFKEIKNYVLNEIKANDFNTPYEFILDWINIHCNNKSWSTESKYHTSYGLKHAIENDYPYYNSKYNKYTHGYCANNWVKCALYELGYKLKTSSNIIITNSNKDYILENDINFIYKHGKNK